ncbi:ATP-binding protein [Flaviramulus basaltis]|uniref:ATP-binding protein n=1 Tax=Flaviramulus basaltis TaxID=369401 RepID=UPI0011609920|nr:sensor histidine kinase [Flaviramulus basaltis]
MSWSQNEIQAKLDSFYTYTSKSNNSKIYNLDTRLSYAKEAKNIAVGLKIDSLIVKSNLNTSQIYLDSGLYNIFLRTSHQNLNFSQKIKDSASMALICKKFGDYYDTRLADSAFYYYHKSEKLYRALNDNLNTSELLLDIAIIQKNEKDLTGSEVASFEAIRLLEELKPSDIINKRKAFLYNNLGVVYNHLEEYDAAIIYHNKALDLKRKLDGNNEITIDNSLNNLGHTYKNAGQYKLAIKNYNEVLSNNNFVKERPKIYALVLDNYAHTLYLSKDFKNLPELYFKALKVLDSVNPNDYKSIIINQHLAEYYNDNNNKDSAKYYGYKAKEISEQYHNDDLLNSLLLLSKIEDDSMAAIHLKAYVKLSDSLQKNERTIRNKFARIRFETDQIEQENIQISKERKWLFVISIVIILAAFLLYLVINQRNKNKELKFIQKQQETNEEIYNLMLSQNEGIEEARALEKKRISEELHDGVLGRLFGTRLSLDSLNMNNSIEAIKTRSQYIDELKSIEQDIRKVSHELNTDFVSGSGFIDIIKTLVETQSLAYKLSYNFEHDDVINWDEISNKMKIHIYRIIQESLHNIYKHASATDVKISFKLKNNVICLTMTDNGSGFDVSKAKSGIGLKNMNSRINEINGTIDITSQKDLGTTVIINAPLA